MSDTGLKNADIDPATAETGSIGSRGGSRKGSVVGDCTVDRKISPDDVSRGGSIRRRSTLVAPPFGSNGAMKPSEGEGAVQRVVTARRDSNMPNDEGNGTKSEAQEAAGYHEIIAWMKDHLVLPGFVLKNHWTDDHDEAVVNFAIGGSSMRLFAAMVDGGLVLSSNPAKLASSEGSVMPHTINFFVRPEGGVIGPSRLDNIHFGSINGSAVDSLLRLLKGMFSPKVFKRQTGWTESVKSELTGHYHRFMASLVEMSNQAKGKTVMYLPEELTEVADPSVAAKDKDLVQQLESIVIHWTRQIKDVVNNHDNALTAEILGPLEEIEFWRSRTVDLSGISEQLMSKDVQVVVSILDTANSSYLAPFNILSQRIKEGSIEANNNLKFLESITTPCQNLARAQPREIPALLPGLLSCIRMIWNLSKFYNTEERLTGLLRKISNQIIHRCCAEINLEAIFDGDIDAAMAVLNESRACSIEWKVIYRRGTSSGRMMDECSIAFTSLDPEREAANLRMGRFPIDTCSVGSTAKPEADAVYRKTALLIRRNTPDPSRHWNFDDASIFAQIDAFVQRCSELLEVCESQIQFARKSMAEGSGSVALPEFGGTRGQEISKALLGIQDSFEAQIDRLRNLDYAILDVKTSRWHDDYNSFKDIVKDLEVMYTNVINTAFEGITRIMDAVAMLEIFYTLARRDAIKQTCLKKTAYTYHLFVRYVEGLRHEFDENRRRPPLRPNEPPFSGSAMWAHSLARAVEEAWFHLKNCKRMAKAMASDEAEAALSMSACREAQAAYTVFVSVIGDFKANRYQAWVDHLNSVIETAPLAARLDVPLLRRADSEPTIPSHQSATTQQQQLVAGRTSVGVTSKTTQSPGQSTGGGAKIASGATLGVGASTNSSSSAVGIAGVIPGMKSLHHNQHLVCNFDLDLLTLFAEVSHWEKFQGEFSVPYLAHDFCNQREKLREQREHVMLVVRAYNSILDELDPSERKLFTDNIRRLDKRIHQGMTKLTWSSKGIVEFYVRDCCSHAGETREIVLGVHRQKEAVVRQCRLLSQLQLLRIDKNIVYDDKDFARHQAEHCIGVQSKMKWSHDMILSSMREIFACFEGGTSEVKREWRSLVAQTDSNIEHALRNTVKKSLQQLSRAINGDAKTEPQTLFKVNIVLDSARVDYRPTMINLTHVTNIVAKELIGTVKSIPRVREALGEACPKKAGVVVAPITSTGSPAPKAVPNAEGEEGANQVAGEKTGGEVKRTAEGADIVPVAQVLTPSFYNIISNDEDTLKIVVQVMNGMSASATELQKYLSYWDKYKYIWENDKDGFIRRYAKAHRGLSQFQADIGRYRELQADIVQEESSHTINFINIDCSQLKAALVGHCSQWQAKLTGLLNQNAAAELRGLHELFESSTTRLRVQPANLDHLSESWNLLETMKKDVPAIEAKFGPLEETYAILSKFEVTASEDEQKLLTNLQQAGEDFQEMLKDVEQMLNKCKINMKRDLENSITNYNDSVLAVYQDACTALPYGGNIGVEDAFKVIEEYKTKVESVRATQAAMQGGLDVFAMDSPAHKELKDLERDLDLMEQVWTVSKEWEIAWDGWKTGLFTDLDVEEMETAAGTFTKKIGKLGRDMKKWKVWESMREKVEQFRQTMPLIQDLKNPALRQRHWDALRSELGKNFNPEAADFNLEGIFNLGLHNLAEFIGELSTNANKELGIEQSLVDLEERWKYINIDMGEYKDKYFKIRSTDDLFQVLEEDSVQLSTIKASKFYNSFADKIHRWETALNAVSETVEMVLAVQKKWMYLESIFMASEDICKQLPRESAIFTEVNADFCQLMRDIHANPNAMGACCADPHMMERVTAMDENLEQIQKSLDQYLETKRMIFPRFYFVSDDDLLEILGQSRDPEAVQKHLKKCFEGIKDIHLIPPGKHMNKTWEASSLTSPDGETVALTANLIIEGAVELWLVGLEKAMQIALQKLLACSLQAYKGKKDKWVKDYQGQLLISTGAIQWTNDCSKALNAIAGGNKTALKALKKKQVGYLNKMSDMVRGQLTKIERNKLVALITMEIHNRDVMERMVKAGCASTSDFEWLSQLRFVFCREEGQHGICSVRQTNCQLEYSYEYQGNNGRLVVTPLTDRCVLTLTTAMYLHRGGNPLGPAGTGKTETVKDLGKNLAKYVVVINCSDGQDYKSVGRVFSGLVQSGSWGCFDEFNRIKIEVISVVAVQVLSILNALSASKESLVFMGNTIKCNRNCGIFITMNPGYAGRTELPDNLKALMRPVAMMTPDLAMIAEVMLAAEGFREARVLAKKTVTLYSLMIQQLSKQDHYDYGLRNLKAVLNMAGALKRADPNMNEEAILMRALRDMNLPKFIKDDERLFRLLLGDLFPSLELPISEYGALQVAVEKDLSEKGLQQHPFLIMKIIQLSDSQLTRHCNMLVGRTMSGKSVAWKTLMNAKVQLSKDGVEGYHPVHPHVINPKSVTLNELYGAYDLSTFEWADGILSTIFKQSAESDKPDEKWIMFDGPIDALWIESMNSVMDDNKILTLINGDRIPLTNTMSLLFEVEDLAVASPATVSRAGMIFLDVDEMGWQPFVSSWLQQRFGDDPDHMSFHQNLFTKYVEGILAFKESNVAEPVPVGDFNAVQSLCTLYDAFRDNSDSSGLQREAGGYFGLAEKWFVFAMVWSIMAAADEAGRAKLDTFLRDVEPQFPPNATVYDYYVDPKKLTWEPWEPKVAPFRYLKTTPFHKMIVPTVDTIRNSFILGTLWAAKRNMLLVGSSGTGKTVLAFSELSRLPETHSQLVINFSATTDSGKTQATIEQAMEKRSKDKFGPVGGKQLVIFLDDFNMPMRTSHESPFQPPLELLRFWIDYGGWYDRAKCAWRYILDTQLICAMAPPGGARAEISSRTQSRFNLLNLTVPDDAQVVRIFDSILSPKLAEFDGEIKPLGAHIAQATLRAIGASPPVGQVYQTSVETFLPTPLKSHYLFNMRDVAKVIEGIMQATPSTVDSRESAIRLWVHECQRAFSDRFVQDAADDEGRFREVLDAQLKTTFGTNWSELFSSCEDEALGSVFTACSGDGSDDVFSYEEQVSLDKLKMFLEERLEDYNMEPKLVSMQLVLFKDAVRHVARIHRVLSLKRGNLMLVGVGGSGRQSLTRLAAYMSGQELFVIEITKNYRQMEFREDLKALFEKVAIGGRPVTFLFNDNQIKEEGFLEDINNILQSGEVPNMYGKDEIPQVLDGVRKAAKQAGVEETTEALWSFFIDRVRENLHVVLAMSPIGESFRNRTRMYPGLVNCTTIDWFQQWPSDALVEVATKFIQDIQMDDESYRSKVASVFSSMHTSVVVSSARMLAELKRYNYVTPTNFLELVKGYRVILAERRGSLSEQCNKLRNGLTKLEEAREQVETMSVQLEDKKIVVAQAQKDCEELLVEIVSERRVADEQKKQVEQESERIGKDAVECQVIADDAQADLAVAMPALEKAMAEVDKLDKTSITEVKAYSKPPPLVETVMAAVMTLMGRGSDWATAKKALGEGNFLGQVKSFNKDNVSNALMAKVKKYVNNSEFSQENVAKVSTAASALCVWVHAIYLYSNVAKDVAPKRARLKEAQETLAQKQAGLKAAQEQLAEVVAKVEMLKNRYDESVGQKNALMEESQMLQDKLERADKLVGGLAGEFVRWQASIGTYEAMIERLVGDSLIAAAFLSYAGTFDTIYRKALVSGWIHDVAEQELPATEGFSFTGFLAKPTDVRSWNIQGLPKDDFSTENGVIVTRGSRWPLMIDPQGQANKWIKAMEGSNLSVVDLNTKDFLRQMGNCIQYGLPCLLQDVLEELDPSIEPVLSKAIIKQGTREVVRLGDKELDWSRDFRLYITTKLANPHYTPEVSTKTTVVNFSVKQLGLEAQLLGIVVQQEQPSLEEQSSELTVKVATGKKKIADLEDEILRLLSESTGSLLDDISLVNTLQDSKTISEEVTQQLQIAEETAVKIDAAREGYRSAAVRASVAYFVLDDLARVDPMYQFSLDAYVDLFNASIESSRTGEEDGVADRCDVINKHHTLSVYEYTCRGLFERHKLLFSLELCFRILAQEKKVPAEEFNFLLYGGVVVDRSGQRPNPCKEWVDEGAWDNVTELDKLSAFSGFALSFEQSPRDWKTWFLSAKPEESPLPGDWENKCSDLQKLCVLRSLRADRILFSASTYVSNNLGPQFADPPTFDLKMVLNGSTTKTPLIFVLSPGVDPTAQVQALAAAQGIKMANVALGQGQAPAAIRMIEGGSKEGHWVFLANCHLMLSWMPDLEKIVEDLCVGDPHADFRLWLSSAPNPKFPISILRRGLKMTTEPPAGLRANMATLYNLVSQEQFNRCCQGFRYRKLLFALSWFHAILLERRKFKSLGFNVPYEFNESDFSICHDLVIVFLDEYPDKVPFDAMRYLIAEANYGGRVTDEWDRRLVNVYMNQFFCAAAIEESNFLLSELKEYYVPPDGDLQSYKEFIKRLPKTDHPASFGQHVNADITSLIDDTNALLGTMTSLAPKAAAEGGETDEQKISQQADLLSEQVPPTLKMKDVKNALQSRSDPDPMKTVLLQEAERYNSLLLGVSRQLADLNRAVKGLVVVTPELEEISQALLQGRVPKAWSKCYPSLKPLGSWMRDLIIRADQIRDWAMTAMPKVFWLPGMTYPTGFLTALLQTSARRNGIAIDTLSWEFSVLGQDASAPSSYPKEGAYCDGLFLDGARWNRQEGCLEEPLPMELFCQMPVIHFKPVESKKKTAKGVYVCPTYMYPLRTGSRERPSFVIAAELKAGKHSSDLWTKRGVALLLSIAA